MKLQPITRLIAAAALSSTALADDPPPFDWEAVAASRDIVFHDCYAGFRCARLLVPLDWQNRSDPRTVSLAVVSLPAEVPYADPSFAGPILTNPGGPGGSGVDFVRSSGRRLRRIVDKPGRRRYEMVSFDPRGVGHSRPRADCFPGAALVRDAFLLELRGNGALDASRGAVPYQLGLFRGYSEHCSQVEGGAGDIFEFMNTPSVARDMVQIVDKLAELRARDGDERRPELRKRRDGDDVPRLQYMGFSYGTALGNYFASLFPERIGRIVLDGVVNAVDYATGAGWLTNTVDADEIVANFYAGCHDAGPATCALARAADSSGDAIRGRVDAWLADLDESPMTVAASPGGSIVAITSRDVRGLLGTVIYRPIETFGPFARIVDAAMAGNTTELLRSLDVKGDLPHLGDACNVDNGRGNQSGRAAGAPIREATFGVLCGDGDSVRDMGTPWWRRYVADQVRQSSTMGPFWSTIRLSCSAWPFTARWLFKGPFTTPEFGRGDSGLPVPGKPAAPLLFLSNRLDPVTPLRAARAMAAKHPGAGLVVQEALGHCALGAADSPCVARIVADYFDSGAVPSNETSCDIACGPWDEGCVVASWQGRRGALGVVGHSRRFPLGVFH